MDLSIIIVSYNSRHFLHYTLLSVVKAVQSIEAEVIVIDNASTDNTVDFLKPLFPAFRFIQAGANLGFAKANNWALSIATGRYILFLNPDVLLPEDSLAICLEFMNKQSGAGAVGVRMVDGSGQFLPESKRGFPALWNAACKFLGLSTVFPRSKLFAGYYLGHLPANEAAKIDVVSGAFMMTPREILTRVGGFDERYFMYGEDIDLSYTIQQAGFDNYYLPSATVVHFKGESTNRDAQYFDRFYGAMELFATKHMKSSVSLLKPLIALQKKIAEQRKNGSKTLNRPGAVRMIGDHQSIAEALAILQKNGIKEDETAKACLLAEGRDFGFKAVIDRMEQSSGLPCLIHSAGTETILYSPDPASSGQILTE